MNALTIVRKAGGPVLVARELGLHHTTVLGWRHVPGVHARTVARLAKLHPSQVRPDLYDPPPTEIADLTATAAAQGLTRLKCIKLTDAEIAERLVVSAETVNRWRKGAGRMSRTHAKQVEKLFGIPRHLLRPDLFEPPPDAGGVGAELEPCPPVLRGAA